MWYRVRKYMGFVEQEAARHDRKAGDAPKKKNGQLAIF
jgi:hypothetical protein